MPPGGPLKTDVYAGAMCALGLWAALSVFFIPGLLFAWIESVALSGVAAGTNDLLRLEATQLYIWATIGMVLVWLISWVVSICAGNE